MIGLSWTAPANEGGDPVVDYAIYFTEQDSFTFTLLADAVTDLSYTTVQPLVTGTTYKFFVKASNTVGQGPMSNTIEVLLA